MIWIAVVCYLFQKLTHFLKERLAVVAVSAVSYCQGGVISGGHCVHDSIALTLTSLNIAVVMLTDCSDNYLVVIWFLAPLYHG